MRVAHADGGAPVHLTYCSSIHPAESWPQVRAALQHHAPRVKRLVSPDAPFAIGLRLAGQAAEQLANQTARQELQALLREHGLYTTTINGFPHGNFHGTTVKERVYLPDWRSPERKRYSDRLADLLADLLPADAAYGSVSTVPGAFKPTVTEPADALAIADQLVAHAAELVRLRERTGKSIVLAIEPEPHCLLETVDETADFFARHLRSERAVAQLAADTGLAHHRAAEALTRHLGVCLDACHAAVEYERAGDLLATLAGADIPIAKLQLSSALRVPRMDDQIAGALTPFLDPVYLHQVVERSGQQLTRYPDLPEALSAGAYRKRPCEWRIHFHVPVFLARLPHFETTQAFLRELLGHHARTRISDHLEVETYTWDVLPPELRDTAVTEAIARELSFCLACCRADQAGHQAGEEGQTAQEGPS